MGKKTEKSKKKTTRKTIKVDEFNKLKSAVEYLYKDRKRLVDELKRERTRIDRIVQVLLNTIPKELLNQEISFHGSDCRGLRRDCGSNGTLRNFLTYIIDHL